MQPESETEIVKEIDDQLDSLVSILNERDATLSQHMDLFIAKADGRFEALEADLKEVKDSFITTLNNSTAIEGLIASKADRADLDKLTATMNKEMLEMINAEVVDIIQENLDGKVDNAALELTNGQLADLRAGLDAQTDTQNILKEKLQTKVDIDQLAEFVTNAQLADTQSVLKEKLQTKVDIDQLAEFVTNAQLADTQNILKEKLKTKVDADQLAEFVTREQLADTQTSLQEKLQQKANVDQLAGFVTCEQLADTQNILKEKLQQKADVSQLTEFVTRPQLADIQNALKTKVDVDQLAEFTTNAQLTDIQNALKTKVDVDQLTEFVTNTQLQNIQKVDASPLTADDLQGALSDIRSELQKKMDNTQLSNLVTTAQLNELQHITENMVDKSQLITLITTINAANAALKNELQAKLDAQSVQLAQMQAKLDAQIPANVPQSKNNSISIEYTPAVTAGRIFPGIDRPRNLNELANLVLETRTRIDEVIVQTSNILHRTT
jgi:hypothetical protein